MSEQDKQDLQIREEIEHSNTMELHAPQVEMPQQNAGLSPLVLAAMDGRLDVDKLDKLLDIQAKYESMEAEKAFHAAMAEFKVDAPPVAKDMDNSQYGSKYSSKGALFNTINPHLAKHGLSASHDINQADGRITVTCVLTHKLGHSESVTMSGPPDKSGSKNPLQEIKSTKTYLEIATYEAVTGISSGNATDDDGQGYQSNVEYIDDDQLANLHALMEEVSANKDAFLKVLKVEEFGQLPANKLPGAIKLLEGKRKNAS